MLQRVQRACYAVPVTDSQILPQKHPLQRKGCFCFMALKLIPFYGTLVNRPLSPEKTATQSHVLIFGAIEAHSIGEKGCIASNKTIAEETGLSISRVASIISELNSAGWIEVQLGEKGNRKQIIPLSILAMRGNPPLPCVATPLASSGNIYNKLDNNRDITPLRDEATTKPKAEDEVKKMFYQVVKQYNLTVLNHNHVSGWCTKLKATFNEERSKKYLKLLLVRDLNAERSTHEFVPTLNRPLDIVDKAAKIIRYYNDNRRPAAAPDMNATLERERRQEEEAERIRNGGSDEQA